MADKKDPTALTARELELLSKGWSCMKNEPEMDYVKLAAVMNMTNVRSASNAWSKIKHKLWGDAPATPKSNGKKRGVSTDADADDDAPTSTPSVKKAKKARVAKPKKEAPVDSDDEAAPAVKEEKSEEPADEDEEDQGFN